MSDRKRKSNPFPHGLYFTDESKLEHAGRYLTRTLEVWAPSYASDLEYLPDFLAQRSQLSLPENARSKAAWEAELARLDDMGIRHAMTSRTWARCFELAWFHPAEKTTGDDRWIGPRVKCVHDNYHELQADLAMLASILRKARGVFGKAERWSDKCVSPAYMEAHALETPDRFRAVLAAHKATRMKPLEVKPQDGRTWSDTWYVVSSLQ